MELEIMLEIHSGELKVRLLKDFVKLITRMVFQLCGETGQIQEVLVIQLAQSVQEFQQIGLE